MDKKLNLPLYTSKDDTKRQFEGAIITEVEHVHSTVLTLEGGQKVTVTGDFANAYGAQAGAVYAQAINLEGVATGDAAIMSQEAFGDAFESNDAPTTETLAEEVNATEETTQEAPAAEEAAPTPEQASE